MTELMQQLQQWANDKLYDWEGKRFKTPYGWIDHEDLVLMAGNGLDFIKKDYRLRHSQMGKILLVLDGTIQVWRPVEHYPLKEGDTVLVRINPELKHKSAIGFVVCRYEIEGFEGEGTVYHDLLIQRPLIGDDMSDVLCDAKNYEGNEINPCDYQLKLSDITHWQPLPQPPQKEN